MVLQFTIGVKMKNKEKTREITKEDVLAQTKWLIKNYYSRNIKDILPFFDPDFVWIDAWNYQYIKGIDAFVQSALADDKAAPALIDDEEYQLLFHEGGLWIVYSSCTAAVSDKDSSLIRTKIRNTYIWQQREDKLFLLYIHGSNAKNPLLSADSFPLPDGKDDVPEQPSKLCIKGMDGILYFLYPDEIHYIYSNKNIRYIRTAQITIPTKISLNELNEKLPDFIFVHRSYLTDIRRIYSLKRYEIQLLNGEILPVGKERYLNLQNQLKTQLSINEHSEKIFMEKCLTNQ